MPVIIEVDHLTKDFDHYRVIDDLCFTINSGEIVGLLGPNGAGKTTLIHMLLGLLLPTRGEIRIFGMDMPQDRSRILQRANFSSAYVQMPFSLTPLQNLEIAGRLYGVRKAKEKARELLRLMGIEAMSDRPTRALSSGQLSRLNLAKSLINDPELLLLDEPTASMDPDIADQTRVILKKIQKEKNMTILYTSHNMKEVEAMADRILFLHKGFIVAEGSPKDLVSHFKEEDLEQVFLKIARGK